MKENINLVSVTLKIDQDIALFILLAADGSVNRMGNGSLEHREKALFIGISEGLFAQFMEKVEDEIFAHAGRYTLPKPKGPLCTLTIVFQLSEEENTGFEFVYGAYSDGPPHEIKELTRHAVAVTEPWFEEQKAMAKSQKGEASDDSAPPKRRWWPFGGRN